MDLSNVLILGGTGTFGSAFVPAALATGEVERLAVFSRDEHKQFHMRRALGDDKRLRWFIGDVRDYDRLRLAMRGVDTVVQAAALKHVPSGEANPFEHVRTNVLGSQNVALAAAEEGVERVMGVSTDKAVEPTTLYGATKLCMERLFIASNANIGRTKLSCVRYGNVLGSRGSFLETLRTLKEKGAKTFPLRSMESTRFWLSAEDAASFVLARLADMEGGEIFVPKLPASSAYAFAKSILPDAEPAMEEMPVGEKVHETLISGNESQMVEERESYFIIRPHGPRSTARQWRYTSNEQRAPVS